VTRLDIVEQGPRQRWRRLRVLAAAGLLALAAGALLSRGGDPAPAPAAEPSAQSEPTRTGRPTPRVSVGDSNPVTINALFPEERGSGDTRRIDLTFPDGSRATLTYPADLRLAELGVRPQIGGTLMTDGELQPRLLVAPMRGEAEVARNGPMIRRLEDNVTLWPQPPGSPGAGEVLLFEFGRWRLALTDRRAGLTFEQRQAWARNLRGRVTKDGFLVLSARPPLVLSRPGAVYAERPYGPQLWIGGDGGPLIVLTPTPDCAERAVVPPTVRDRPGDSAARCRGDVHVAVAGERDFVRRVIEEVRVRYTPRGRGG